jgi:hypothetical protein
VVLIGTNYRVSQKTVLCVFLAKNFQKNLELLWLERPSQHGLKTYVKNPKICSKMLFLGVILHEKHDSDIIFTPNASEIVKMSVF